MENEDKKVWYFSKDGEYIIKRGYRVAMDAKVYRRKILLGNYAMVGCLPASLYLNDV